MYNTTEKLIELIEQSYYCDIVSLAEDLVSKGVTVPVRCKDCIFSFKSGDELLCTQFYEKLVHSDDFCSFAERKDNDRKAD